MREIWFLIAGLAICTFGLRLAGFYLGASLPRQGAWARAFNALPGTVIASLVTLLVLRGGPREWLAALVSVVVALTTRSLPLTMAVGIGAVWALRHWG